MHMPPEQRCATYGVIVDSGACRPYGVCRIAPSSQAVEAPAILTTSFQGTNRIIRVAGMRAHEPRSVPRLQLPNLHRKSVRVGYGESVSGRLSQL